MESLEVIWNGLHSEDQHKMAIKGMNLQHEEGVRNVCAEHSDPPNLLEKKKAHAGPNEESPVGLVRPTVVPGVGAQLPR